MSSIPVQRLGANARDAYLAHLHALSSEDARLRFGASLSREAITRYVDAIDFGRDAIFGVHGDGMRLIGAAHLAFGPDDAELGLSVLADARRHGVGGALIARASEYARNRASTRLFMHCLAENAAMMRLARSAGMQVVVDSGDADAHVALPPATPMSVTSEMLAERVALYDYALKSNVETWRRMGAALMGVPSA
ncbi:MAG: GNAT family N-acetyltransferase [Burkholderiales bacterium]